MHITSPGGTNLRFRVGSRVVNRQDGDASAARAARGQVLIDREIELPAGVARVAPLEETVEGTIVFPPSQWDARPVEGLRLHFERGQVVRVEATSGREAVEREMQTAGEAGRRFREFALGFNPLLVVPERTPWMPTTATAPAWSGCRSATTPSSVAPSAAATCAGTSSPTSR